MVRAEKLDKIESKLGTIAVTLAAQHTTLKEHARRSDALEAQVDILRQSYSEFQGMLKLLQLTAIVTGIIAVIIEMAGFWLKLRH